MALGGHIEVVYVFAASRDNIALPMAKTTRSGHKPNPGQDTNPTQTGKPQPASNSSSI